MSYILDALRRADAERQRGGVPGLHAQPAAPAPAGVDRAPRFGAAALGLAAVGLLLAGGAAVWWLGGGRGVAEPAVRNPSAGVVTAPPLVPSVLVAAQALPAAPLSGLPSAVPTAPAVPTQPLPAAPLPLPLAPSTRPLAPAPRSAAVQPTVPAAPARLPRLADLPEGLRHELPPLNLGGSVFADQPAARLVIVNGQVFREGEQPAPGLLVQQIGLRAVVFEFRGQRFEAPL